MITYFPTITGSLTINGDLTVTGNSSMSASNALSSSYAQTASYANNFIVAGTITAQTLVVQTITSSVEYSSGSNIFGNSLTNTQTFTGSVNITGSLTVNNTTATLGTGSANYVLKYLSSNIVGNSLIWDNGTNVGIGNTNTSYTLDVTGTGRFTGALTLGTTAAPSYGSGSLGVNLGILNIQNVAGVQGSYANNAYYNGTNWIGISVSYNATAVRLIQTGDINFHSAATVTAGGTLTTWDTTDVKMSIKASGNVGIGFTSPTSSLNVNGNASIGANLSPSMLPHGLDTNGRALVIAGSGTNPNYGALFLANNNTESSGALLGALLYSQTVTGKSGTNPASKAAISVWSVGSGGSVGGYGGYMGFFTRPDNGSGDVGAYERMRIDQNGNIGMGTTNPSTRLTISKPIDFAAYGSGSQALDFKVYFPGYDVDTVKASIYVGVSNTGTLNTQGGYMAFMTSLDGSLAERVRIEKNGNVGIGITSPGYKLDLTALGYGIQHYGDSSNYLRTYCGSTYQIIESNGTNQFGYVGGNFFAQTGGTERMRITSGGNVGIGTSSPSYSFQTAGSTYIAGSCKFIVNGNNYNENIRTYAGSNDYSSYIMGAVSGDSASGVGQWSIVRWPSANSYQFTIRYNNTDFFYLYANGNYSFYGTNVSDARKKTNITYIEDSQLNTIMKLKPATFSKINPSMYSEDGETYINNNTHTGFIAQDVLAEGIPNILTGSEEEGYGLDYDGILSLTVKALQELKSENDSLKLRIEALENK